MLCFFKKVYAFNIKVREYIVGIKQTPTIIGISDADLKIVEKICDKMKHIITKEGTEEGTEE